jgi:hypothetical protein
MGAVGRCMVVRPEVGVCGRDRFALAKAAMRQSRRAHCTLAHRPQMRGTIWGGGWSMGGRLGGDRNRDVGGGAREKGRAGEANPSTEDKV